MERHVEALAFDLLVDTQADDRLDRHEDNEAADGVISDDDPDADELIDDLPGIALDKAGRSAILVDGEDTGQNRTSGPPYGMDAKTIERVVIAEDALEPGGSEVAEHACGDADHQRAGRAAEALPPRARHTTAPGAPAAA